MRPVLRDKATCLNAAALFDDVFFILGRSFLIACILSRQSCRSDGPIAAVSEVIFLLTEYFYRRFYTRGDCVDPHRRRPVVLTRS